MEEATALLDREITQELMDLYMQDPESEGYGAATERITKLYKLRVDQALAESELELKTKQAESEFELKVKQLEEGKKDRRVKFGVDVAAVSLPLVFSWIWMKRGFKFEETGAFTSQTFKGLFSKFRLTK